MISNIVFGFLDILVRILDVPNPDFGLFVVVTFSPHKQCSNSIHSHTPPLHKSLLIYKSYLCRRWLTSTIDKILFFLLVDFPSSEFYMPMFRNILSAPSSQVMWTRRILLVHTAY